MRRQKQGTEERNEGQGKIRKRGCWSSSSSSLIQKYRFKRAILVGKRGGSSTPVPTWKMSSPVPLSARKLAATFWEINDVPSPPAKSKKDMRRRKTRSIERIAHAHAHAHVSDPISERKDRSHQRRTSAISQKLQLTDFNLGGFDSLSNASLMEIERVRTQNGCTVGTKTRLKDVSNGLTTSKELLKVLNRIWGLEEKRSSSISLVSALRVELDRARIQVDQLIQEQRSNRNEISYLMKHFAEEKAVWKSKEQDRIRVAIASIAGELEVEKKLRRQTERLNKKLGKELADTKASFSKAMKELESEKRAREILEQVCDELARGIGEDRAQVEELKRESAKVREEVEKEREMLQLADVLREERVQMKLLEAKYHFEEKNAVVDRLRSELEDYMRTKMDQEKVNDGSPRSGRSEEIRNYLRKTYFFGSCQNGEREDDEGEGEGEREVEDGQELEGGEEDSAESDLHSIELNMDNHSKSYEWSYAGGDSAAQDDSKRVSVEEFKGRKSISEKIQWASISLDRGTKSDFSTKIQENSDGVDRGRLLLSEVDSQARTKGYEDEIKRQHKSAKCLRDHILSGSKLESVKGFTSPTQQWGQSSPSHDRGSVVRESSMVMPGSTVKARMAATRGERQTSMHPRQ